MERNGRQRRIRLVERVMIRPIVIYNVAVRGSLRGICCLDEPSVGVGRESPILIKSQVPQLAMHAG